MAIESVKPAEQLPAITGHYIEDGWERDSKLPLGVHNRLACVERCVVGMNTIHRMLAADSIGKADVADNPGEVVFPAALAPVDVEGLRLAMQELGDKAQTLLEAIRNREQVRLAAV